MALRPREKTVEDALDLALKVYEPRWELEDREVLLGFGERHVRYTGLDLSRYDVFQGLVRHDSLYVLANEMLLFSYAMGLTPITMGVTVEETEEQFIVSRDDWHLLRPLSFGGTLPNIANLQEAKDFKDLRRRDERLLKIYRFFNGQPPKGLVRPQYAEAINTVGMDRSIICKFREPMTAEKVSRTPSPYIKLRGRQPAG